MPYLVEKAQLIGCRDDEAHSAMGRHHATGGPHMVQDCIHLRLVRAKFLPGDARSFPRMGAAFLAGGAEEHVFFGHSYVVQEAGANRILLVHRCAVPIQPSCKENRLARRLDTMGSDIAVLAVVGNV